MKLKGAFEQCGEFMFGRAIERVKAKLMGQPDPLEPILITSTFYIFECIEAHIRHIDAGLGGVSVPVALGEIVETQDTSINCLDVSKFKLLRTEKRTMYI